jgi:alpha-amylase/alpha-mannosidase (GH57 family)
MVMKRYICIHGHFYQPPRENPWLESIELQDSAYPFHDWNERITHECYAPNGAARILDGENHIVEIINNYSYLSFNFGPTLLSWMEAKQPKAYQAILDADRESVERFSGHGSALAQVFNHMIMPLANQRDRDTQVRWGIRDFEHRFGRKPEGMWLAETAANTETLETLAAHGITFTILSPYQAGRVRRVGERSWQDVVGGRVDPATAYVQHLPSGRSINLFFYDGPISQGVAFEGLLRRGENLANRLLGALSDDRPWPQMVHIATDGETYGHHHRYGEMALAYACKYIEANDTVQLTNYGEFLEKHPPTHEVEIIENTSWSCYHGVERWRSDCGCNSGGHPGWNQSWRGPLRDALDWLRDKMATCYAEKGRDLLANPWAARDAYIELILDRSDSNVDAFLEQHVARKLTQMEKTRLLKLMELQRHAMLMYTSCGWFFDELSGIETVQVIQYAGRVIQLAEELFGDEIEQPFLERLKLAKSNIPEHGDGQQIYEKFVKPAMIDLESVGAHYAVSSLFEPYGQQTSIYHYTVEQEDNQVFDSGRTRLAIGKSRITSEITRESVLLSYGALHFGDHNLNCGVRKFISQRAYQGFIQEASDSFRRADLAEVIRILDRNFLGLTYSLRSLFRDEQRTILRQILDTTLHESEATYRQLYTQNASLIAFLLDLGIPLPRGLHTAVEFVLNADFRRAIEGDHIDLERIRTILAEARKADIEFDTAGLARMLEELLDNDIDRLSQHPSDLATLEKLDAMVALVRELPFQVDLWQAQNVYYLMLQTVYPTLKARSIEGEEHAHTWVQCFVSLGEHVGVRVREDG